MFNTVKTPAKGRANSIIVCYINVMEKLWMS